VRLRTYTRHGSVLTREIPSPRALPCSRDCY
jgi:hypothetical protein